MHPIFEKLAKVLALEKEQGYGDRAVIGGLERFLPNWRQKARQEVNGESGTRLVEEVASLLEGYGSLDLEERKEVLDSALAALRRGSPPPSRPPEGSDGGEASDGKKQRSARETSHRAERKRPPALDLDVPVSRIMGISDTYSKRLVRLGVHTVRDMLYLIPRRYDDYSELKKIKELQYGEETTVVGTVWETENRDTRSGGSITTTILSDGTGTVQVTWFNQPYMARHMKAGEKVVVSGKVDEYLGRLVFQAPEWEPYREERVHTGRLVPVYPLTSGISARWLRRMMKRLVDNWVPRVLDPLPDAVRERQTLVDLPTALRQIHFPTSESMIQQARRRLCFDEFLLIQLGVLRQRRKWMQRRTQPLDVEEEALEAFLRSLPFELTGAQQRALDEILNDLERSHPMSRLLQGDVGSGKTVVAAGALWMALANGSQSVIMAPTGILAEQHYSTIHDLLRTAEESAPDLLPIDLSVRLLVGSLPSSEKDQIYEELASGEVNVVVGTHALIQEAVDFHNLGLAVIDEQHRFGVKQRAALREKGFDPHVLVMTATPIPRTLALTVYGDLDLSVIDEMPPGRQEIKTRWMEPLERERAYSFVRSQIAKGRQAFIIFPLVEESEKIEAKAAVEEHERLQGEIFPDLRLGLLHGRMRSEEKEAVMERFYRGDLNILVSTPVVEVGIDVPNATVMMVEGADRFGLAQLHQFRGRVGRGEYESYCLLLASEKSAELTPEAKERLQAIESTHDGFELAEKDLQMRGPGEFFGTRQTGLPDLKVARLSDVRILERARAEAMEIFGRDPQLRAPDHERLRRRFHEFWGEGGGDLS